MWDLIVSVSDHCLSFLLFTLYVMNTEALAFNILALMLIWLIHLNCAKKNIRSNKTKQDVWSIVILK